MKRVTSRLRQKQLPNDNRRFRFDIIKHYFSTKTKINHGNSAKANVNNFVSNFLKTTNKIFDVFKWENST